MELIAAVLIALPIWRVAAYLNDISKHLNEIVKQFKNK